jgi:putative hydrolase of the HAD superfamily
LAPLGSTNQYGVVKPKAIIVDFGGVLTTSIFDSFAAFYEEHGIDPEHAEKVLRSAAKHEGILHRVETGALSVEEFNGLLAEAFSEGLEKPVDPAGLKERMFEKVGPEPAMAQAVRTLKDAGIRTGLLSNSWGGKDYPLDFLNTFCDTIVISGEVGLRKPDPDIYLLAAKQLGVEPSEAVFVDDIHRNVEGAEAVGMIGIHHTETAQTLKKLEEIFGLELSSS